ncbi:Uma2 family endonuclease [Nocardia cyriacigeorgica]|uniref:Uma2 family endonuclease n=1 Tax=Nocardia cyriacigeorgica TaxID=135487 RepID=A0A5R8PG72_9NOCA|nr:Uma2 family endonuclease [Nocardia cyriacigeorgica]TLG13433.1 Uma2 family endonuclease [Nocardia cyriacigeorgica]
MTVPAMHPRPGNLREIAEQIERATGLHVEILGGKLVMSPTPRGKHAGTIRRLRQQLEAGIVDGLAAYEVSSIAMPGDEDDYCTPDLVVLPDSWDQDDSWLADPADVELAVEVISKSEKSHTISGKNGWYAAAGVRMLLVVDPRFGRWALYSSPKSGEYPAPVLGEYGTPIMLPAPFGFTVDTGCLPRYGDG